jgi:hypothetical protein
LYENHFVTGGIYRRTILGGKFEFIRLDNLTIDTSVFETTILTPIPHGLAVTSEKISYVALEPKEWIQITLN